MKRSVSYTKNKEQDDWIKFPSNWTEEDAELFWESLPVDCNLSTCLDKLIGKVDDPEALCSYLFRLFGQKHTTAAPMLPPLKVGIRMWDRRGKMLGVVKEIRKKPSAANQWEVLIGKDQNWLPANQLLPYDPASSLFMGKRVGAAAPDTRSVDFPISAIEFYNAVKKNLKKLLGKKPVVKIKESNRPNGISLQIYFDLKDFDGEKKGQFSETSEWLWIGMMKVRDGWGLPAIHFMVEYSPSSPGLRDKRILSMTAAPYEIPKKKSTPEEVLPKFLEGISKLTPESLESGGIKGPSFWND